MSSGTESHPAGNQPLVSIVIPVYNVEDYLDRCMESVIGQSYGNIEVVLVDDGATDSSGAMCDRYAGEDPRITVIHKKNGGLSSARNEGMKHIRGDYVVFIDSDDCIGPNHIRNLVDCAIQTGKPLVVTNATAAYVDEPVDMSPVDDYEMTWFPLTDAIVATVSLSAPFRSYAWGKLYARELFPLLRYPEGKLYEDQFVTYQVVYQAGGAVYESSDDYYYTTDRSGSIINSKPQGKLDFLQAVHDELGFVKQHVPEAYEAVYVRYCQALMDAYGTLARAGHDVCNDSQMDALFAEIRKERRHALTSDLDSLTKRHFILSYIGRFFYTEFLIIHN